MDSQKLKLSLRELSLQYAHKHGFQIDTSHSSAIIFHEIKDNFQPDSFSRIKQKPDWYERTQKAHQNVPNTLEMQSSNSSDALLMNIFCHPHIGEWKGVRDLLQVRTIDPVFGFKALIYKKEHQTDKSEIDMVLDDLFIEAKLTEEDFTQKDASIVEQYEGLTVQFHKDCLIREGERFDNYQIIRNLLAAIQHNKRHILLCDARRSDLVRRYMETVCCLQDVATRKKCRVVFWQEIQSACGSGLRQFLEEKYGLC
jgi:hypothetical protein